MKKLPSLPDIPENEQTPAVKSLLVLLENCIQVIQQAEEIDILKDEVRVLKGEKKRPVFKPSKMDQETDKHSGKDSAPTKNKKRPGSIKRAKNATLIIDEDRVIQPKEDIPSGSRFKGYRDFVAQELRIEKHNTRYRLAHWITPDGQILMGQLPNELNGGHCGPHLRSYILYQHHHCHVTQPLLLEQLNGVLISQRGIKAIESMIMLKLTGKNKHYHGNP